MILQTSGGKPVSDISSLEMAVAPVEKFQEFLATKGKRLTHERAAIVAEVFSSHQHFDADELASRLSGRHDGKNVSRPTIYRTLNTLVEAGMLRRVARPNGREVYEHDYGYPQHDHFICDGCGSLIEFHNESISKLLDEVAAEHGFRMSGHRLEAYGLCATCSRPQRRHEKLDLL